jgi:hypothetical protein
MALDFSAQPVSAPPDTSPLRPSHLFAVDFEFLRASMESLQLDAEHLSFWSALPMKQVNLVLETRVATRQQLRAIRRGLKWRAVDVLDPEDAMAFWSACTPRALAPDIEP